MMEKQKQELPIADKKMLVGIKDSIECPICNKASDYMPEKQGLTKFKCSKCQGFFLAKVEPQVTTQVKRGKPTQGRISIMRRWWFPKDFPFHNGVNTIGRADDEIVSDIAIENDDSISRRSIAIEVSMAELGGYLFKLTVLKSANAVLHNNVPLSEGDSVSLNYGDRIVLGRTKLKFDK